MMVGSSANNLTQMLMQALMNQGGLTKDMIGKKLMTFGANNFYVFQGVRLRVRKKKIHGWVPFSMGENIIWFTEPILQFKLCLTCQW
jgi:hypothetical protein